MPPSRTPASDPSHHNSPTSLKASDFGSHPLTSIPSKPELTRHLTSLHAKLQTASAPNALSLRLPVPSGLKIAEWRSRLSGYHDSSLCDYLEFGWPIGYTSLATPASTHTNHGSTVAAPEIIQAYLEKEQNLRSLCGPFNTSPLINNLVISPMQIVYSRSGKPRVVVDLSFPVGWSVNDGIPKDTYLGEPFTLRLPGVDALVDIIRELGTGCWLFKKDLSRAYRQLRIDPRDYHLLGLRHCNNIYFDIAPPFGLRSAAMCQRTTSAVTYMFQSMGYHCTNYIDDFGGADSAETAQSAFLALGDLFSTLGLESSPDKDCAPSQTMIFLGILFNSIDMTMSVTTDRLHELLSRCQSLLDLCVVSRRDLQSLLGVMSFVTACVRPARIFMSSLLNTLRAHSSSRFCSLTPENTCGRRGGLMVSALDSGSDVPGSSPGRGTALCSWARHFTPIVPLSTQVYKWVPANLLLGVTLRWTSIPSRGE